jgi:hypothetical protein
MVPAAKDYMVSATASILLKSFWQHTMLLLKLFPKGLSIFPFTRVYVHDKKLGWACGDTDIRSRTTLPPIRDGFLVRCGLM